MTQYGFFIDLSRCIGCHSCVISCKQWHNIEPGPVKWMRVHQWETGAYPETRLHILPVTCFHCENPVCVKACPHKAISKEEKYGAVLVDYDKCQGKRKCWQACPYGAPQFEGDGQGQKMSKCNMCIDRLQNGLKPICVLSCSMRALEFGPLEELEKKYGTLRRTEDLPKETITGPAVIFRLSDGKKQVVTWDAKKALALWQKRNPVEGETLPDIFKDVNQVTHPPKGITSRDKLVLKPTTTEEYMYQTTDDE